MTPNSFDAWSELFKFSGALSLLSGAIGMAWWRKDGPDSDNVVSEACDTLINGVLDADKANKIDLHTGRNIRDRLTVEQLEDMNKERNLRRMGNRN